MVLRDSRTVSDTDPDQTGTDEYDRLALQQVGARRAVPEDRDPRVNRAPGTWGESPSDGKRFYTMGGRERTPVREQMEEATEAENQKTKEEAKKRLVDAGLLSPVSSKHVATGLAIAVGIYMAGYLLL